SMRPSPRSMPKRAVRASRSSTSSYVIDKAPGFAGLVRPPRGRCSASWPQPLAAGAARYALRSFPPAVPLGFRHLRRPEPSQRPRQPGLQLLPVHDRVDDAVLEQELRPLEPLGQLLPDRLLDDARPREPD